MKKYIYIVTLLIVGTAMGQQPFVNGLDKNTGTPNEIVTISGSNFSSPTIYFGMGKVATIVNNSADLIQVRVPATATYGPVTVMNSNGLSATSSQFFTLAFDDDSNSASWSSVTAGGELPSLSTAQPTNNNATWDICLCDFDRDDLLDVILTNNGSNANIINADELTIATNNSTGGSANFILSDRDMENDDPTHNLECGDLDGDGRPDLVVTSQTNSRPYLHIYENTTSLVNDPISFSLAQTRITIPQIPDSDPNVDDDMDGNPANDVVTRSPKRVRIADINGDGKKDIVLGSATNSDNVFFIFLNESSVGNVAFSSIGIEITVPDAVDTGSLNIADLDNDGRGDVIITPTTGSDQVRVMRNTSNGSDVSFEFAGVIGNSDSRFEIVIADLNNDGLNDIATTKETILEIFENQGDLEFISRSFNQDGIRNRGIDAGDINGDGLVDIVTASLGSVSSSVGQIVYYENFSVNGETIDFKPAVIEDGGGTMSPIRNVRVGDLNNDGRPDIAFTHNSQNGQGDYRYLINNLKMTPVLTPSSGVYCTNSDFFLRSTEGHQVLYSWDVSGVNPGVNVAEFNMNGNGYSGDKDIFVTVTMADGSMSNPSATITLTHDATDSPAGQPTINTSSGSTNLCVQEELTFTTGASASNYYWYGPDGLIPTCSGSTCNISNEAEAVNSGEYYLIVDNGFCQSPESNKITISVSGPPVIAIDEQNCNDGTITLTAPDYTTAFDYQWKRDGSVNVGSVDDVLINVSNAGVYTLEISDGVCTRISNSITIFDAPISSFDGPSFGAVNEVCADIPVTFTATSTKGANASALTLGYNWTVLGTDGNQVSFTDNGSSITIDNGFSLGTLDAVVTLETIYEGEIGCSIEEKSIVVSDVPAFTADVTAPNDDGGTSAIEKCPSETLTFSFDDAGIITVTWDDPDNTTGDLTVTEPGTYTATYTTNTGCESTHVVVVENLPGLGLSADGPSIVDGEVQLEDGQLDVTLSVDATVISPTWVITLGDALVVDNGSSLEVTPQTPTVEIEVSGTTVGGCTETESITVIGGTFLARKSFSPNEDGNNDCWGIINSSTLTDCTVYIVDSRGRNILVQKLPGEIPEDPDCIWDGTSNGVSVPEGVYYFVMKCADGSRNQTGSILLAR